MRWSELEKVLAGGWDMKKVEEEKGNWREEKRKVARGGGGMEKEEEE
jgi:hypothetical protein